MSTLPINQVLLGDAIAVVLDPFLGSGTTAIACLETDRQFIGVEKDEGYHAIALSRIARSLEVAA